MKKLIIAVSIAAMSTVAIAEGSGHEGGSGGNNGPQAYQTQTAAPSAKASVGDVGSMKMQQGQEQAAVAGSNSTNAGNAQNITFQSPEKQTVDYNHNYSGSQDINYNYSGTQTVKNVPALGGAQLTAANDTCMGSTSLGIAVAGFGGQFGTTWTDANCVLLKNSRELWNMGMKAAALARMCMDANNKDALEVTGFVCPTKKAEEPAPAPKAAVEVTPVAPQAAAFPFSNN